MIGPQGARELLWLERREGYIAQFLQSYPFGSKDGLLVFSHGGLNAAPIENARDDRIGERSHLPGCQLEICGVELFGRDEHQYSVNIR